MPKVFKTLMINTVKPSQDGYGKNYMEEKLCFFSLLCTSNFSDFHVTWSQKSSNHISDRPQQPHKSGQKGGKIVAAKYHHCLDREIREDNKRSKDDKWKKCVKYEGTDQMIRH
jgi:hypothetical protein